MCHAKSWLGPGESRGCMWPRLMVLLSDLKDGKELARQKEACTRVIQLAET